MNTYVGDDAIGASELRQWQYCPRVVWYGRQFGDYRATTAMMQVGIDEEAERRRLEARRTFDQYGIEAVSRKSQAYVWSEALGVRGLVDTLLQLTETTLDQATERKEPCERQLFVPVEFKTTMHSRQRNNVLQLAAYALCIEEMTHSPVEYGFLVLLPQEEVIRQTIGPHVRRTVLDLIDDVRAGLASTELPPPTPMTGRCQSCEFRRFCNDVW